MSILAVMLGAFIFGVVVGFVSAWLIDDSVSDHYMRHGYEDDPLDDMLIARLERERDK